MRATRPIVLVVPREAEGTRLDRFLASTLSAMEGGPSRSELQRWIEHGAVKVDGDARKASEKLKQGARIDVVPEAPPPTEAVADGGVVFEIVHMDDAIVVIDKPAGLVVHPARGHLTGTLVNGLLARGIFDRGMLGGGDEPGAGARDRPGIVHRLDKGTSGIMVVARTARARELLKGQFAAHSIEREYVAICVGDVRAATYATLHGRHPTDRLRFSSKVKTGKRAVTHVRPVERFGGHATLVSCRLETGRTHQIRVHLADHGAPILGDALYGRPPRHPVLREAAIALGRPALHARVLGFVHPTSGVQVRFAAEPPADFQVALATLRAMP
jgi:23S rRNA pseudouridine1911/1915/1917 synthase